MSETKMYYLGTGKEFIKEQCKEYKTLKGVLDAAAKDEILVAWDEDGNVIGSLTDDVHDGALNTNPDGKKVGTVDGATVAAVTVNTADDAGASGDDDSAGTSNENSQNASQDGDNGQSGANTQDKEEGGQFHVEVICDGSLRLRRSASFSNDNECGRASKGQTYMGKRIFMIDGLPMVETIDGLFLSAAAEHIKIERL